MAIYCNCNYLFRLLKTKNNQYLQVLMVNSGANFRIRIPQSLLLISVAIVNLIILKRSPLKLLDISDLVPKSNVLSLIWAHLGFEPGHEQNIDEAVCQDFSLNHLSCERNIFPNSNLGSANEHTQPQVISYSWRPQLFPN